MSKISIENITFYYETVYHPVFEKVSLTLDSDWKLGLIGRNGKGKSTLFKLLEGSLIPQEGKIQTTVNFKVFPYQYDGNYTLTMDVIKECIGGLKSMEERLENADASDEYMEILQQYIDMDGYEIESKIRKELASLGLSSELLEQSFDSLSGGERTCMMIVALFLRKDTFVLLDEPTNHLDVSKRGILKDYLKKQKGFILISHDFDFIDATVDHILAINKADINLEKGNYSTWKHNVLLKEEFERATQEKLIKEISSLEKRAEVARDWSEVGNKQKYHFISDARTNGCQKYMRQAKRAEERVRRDIEEKKMLLQNIEESRNLNIYQDIMEEATIIEVNNLCFSYSADRPLLDNISFRVIPGDRIWIKGENGAGKSTLLKLLAGEIDAGGQILLREETSFSYATQDPKWIKGYLREYLCDDKERELLFREICEQFDMPEDMYERPLETLSSGELKKIDIARAISMRNDILFLDEPLNYMDYMFREQLAKTLVEQNVTVIFVEHNEEFGNHVANRVIEIRN